MNTKALRIILVIIALVILVTMTAAIQVEPPPEGILIGNYDAMVLVALVGVILVASIKLVQKVFPNWQPPENYFKVVQAGLIVVFTFLATAANLLGAGTLIGLVLAEAQNVGQGILMILTALLALWTLSTGLFELFARLKIPFVGARSTPRLRQ